MTNKWFKKKSLFYFIGQFLNIVFLLAIIYFIKTLVADKSIGLLPLVLLFAILLAISSILQYKGKYGSLIVSLVLFLLTLAPGIIFWDGLRGLILPSYIFLVLVFFSLDYFLAKKS